MLQKFQQVGQLNAAADAVQYYRRFGERLTRSDNPLGGDRAGMTAAIALQFGLPWQVEDFIMTDDANDYVDTEYEGSGGNTAVLGFALLLIGFAAGAIAAALMTPKTGKQMRRELKRKAGDLRERVGDWTDQAGDWVDKGSDLAGKASDWAGCCQRPRRAAGQEIPQLILLCDKKTRDRDNVTRWRLPGLESSG